MDLRWWQRAIFYQIYPRSFADSNGDGIGDLDGITARLDYLNDGTDRSLGIDAIWLNPINPSPNRDFGYDVSDYCGIDPSLGTLASFDRLVAEAHRRGIRVIVDLVPNHSSDLHPWFIESRSSRANPKRNWYIWAPGSPERPPNNWQSTFGGSAWKYDERTADYYLHIFYEQQPDLNYRNPEVVEAMHEVLRFWMRRGADGFRVDVLAGLIKDEQLRDNPVRSADDPDIAHYRAGRPLPLYSTDRPEVHEVVRGFRRVLDEFDDRMMVGEVWPLERARLRDYVRAGECQLAFNFWFVLAPYSAARYRAAIQLTETSFGADAWPTWTLSNHDFSRHISRSSQGGGDGEARARVAAMMLLTLRGTPFIYYGDEIGMRDVAIPRERWLDPMGRDGFRTPMQWSDGPQGGFTSGAGSWLPCGDYRKVNVARQLDDPHSMLTFYRRLIRLRRSTPALAEGSYSEVAGAPEDCLVYRRVTARQRVLVALNFSAEPREIRCDGGTILLSTLPERSPDAVSGSIRLSGDEGLVVELS